MKLYPQKRTEDLDLSGIALHPCLHNDLERSTRPQAMEPFSVESWLASKDEDVWTGMMKRVAAFHHKHDFAGNNGHDMGYRIALTVEELGELAAAITKNKPIEEVAEEMADVLILLMGHSLAMNIDLKASFEAKVDKIMQRPARKGRLGIRVTEYTDS